MGGSPDVRFIDFDWAGIAREVCYPLLMNHRDDVWPPDVQEFAPALQSMTGALSNVANVAPL